MDRAIANIRFFALFGRAPATGAIARTARTCASGAKKRRMRESFMLTLMGSFCLLRRG